MPIRSPLNKLIHGLALLAFGAGALILPLGGHASGHPLGNFTTNRFSALEIRPGVVRIHYVVDFAELAAFEEKATIGDGDEPITSVERAEYAESTGKRLLGGFSVGLGERSIEPRLVAARASFRPGQGGLDTLRVSIGYAADLPENRGTLSYVDLNYSSRLGWKEVVASSGSGIRIVDSSVPASSISDELRSYPRELLDDPLEIRTARVEFEPGESATEPDSSSSEAGDTSRDLLGETFTSLIDPETSTPFVVAVILAVLLGAAHALGPGHGKLLLAAYLTGSEARPAHAIRVGLAVSVMHTLSVVVIGLFILWGTTTFRAEEVYPWLGLLSGVAILALGTALTVRRLRERRRSKAGQSSGHQHHHPLPAASSSEKPSVIGLGTIAMGGGLLPSPSALVVLLGAVSLHRAAAGVVLVLAFGVGLAVMLIALGLIVLRTKGVLERSRHRVSLLPILSSSFIAVLGAYLTFRAITTF